MNFLLLQFTKVFNFILNIIFTLLLTNIEFQDFKKKHFIVYIITVLFMTFELKFCLLTYSLTQYSEIKIFLHSILFFILFFSQETYPVRDTKETKMNTRKKKVNFHFLHYGSNC